MLRKHMLKYSLCFVIILGFATTVAAQDKTAPSQDKPSKERQAEKPQPMDLDKMFKDAEKRVQSGDHCGPKTEKDAKPETPIA